jgi:hypothetical protein
MLHRRGGEKECSENTKRTNEIANLCPMGTNAGAATPPPTNPPPPQTGGEMGVWRGTTGEGASKKSRSGSSKMESTARIAIEAPPNPPFELRDEADDLLICYCRHIPWRAAQGPREQQRTWCSHWQMTWQSTPTTAIRRWTFHQPDARSWATAAPHAGPCVRQQRSSLRHDGRLQRIGPNGGAVPSPRSARSDSTPTAAVTWRSPANELPGQSEGGGRRGEKEQ